MYNVRARMESLSGYGLGGVSLATPPLTVNLEPDGEVTLFAVESPDGARLEFFSA